MVLTLIHQGLGLRPREQRALCGEMGCLDSQTVQPQTIIPECTHHTATMEQLPNAGSKPVHRQQRWYNIEPALVHRHVFVVHTQIATSPVFVQHRSTGTMRIHLWPMSQTLIQC